MSTPGISIILPAYNAEACISKMIESILYQSFRNWELIIVNDGSTDSTSDILNRYAQIDKRIKLYHKENGGVSAARQTGIDLAKGDYIIHADADDYMESELLEFLYNEAIKTNADVIFCDFYVVNLNGVKSYRIQNPPDSPDNILRAFFHHLHGSCWNKLVRRDSIIKHSVSFPIGINYCEDLLFWIKLYKYQDIKTSYVPKALYNYVLTENSITRNITRNHHEQHKLFVKNLTDTLSFMDYSCEIESAQFSIFIEAFMNDFITLSEARKELIEKFLKHAFCHTSGIRWKLGYIAILLGCSNLAHKLIHF